MKEHRTGVLAFVLWAGLLILVTLAVHFIYAVWPWPGAAGSAPLREAVLTSINDADRSLRGTSNASLKLPEELPRAENIWEANLVFLAF